MRLVLPLWLALAAPLAFASPNDLRPPPKGHWATDNTGKVSAATLATLDAIAQAVEDSGVGQLGVCVTGTTQGEQPRTFATTVFNRWGIGHAGRNDGILLFVALRDRKSEIILGSGSSVLPAQTDVVMANDVVANFKVGQVDAGLIAAANALSRLMGAIAATPRPAANPTAQVDQLLQPYARHEQQFVERSPRSWVVDPGNVLSASNRAELDLAANDVYAENQGRLFYLVVNIKGSQPSLTELAQVFQAQVQPLSKLPLGVVAYDKGKGQLLLLVPSERTPTGYEMGLVQARQNELANSIAALETAGLVDAGHYVSQVLARPLPSRPMKEVLDEGFQRHETGILGTLGVMLLGGFVSVRRYLRRRPRACEHCHQPRELLSEDADDEHLESGQRKEESIGSVDYDVWWCGRCQDALVLDYSAWFTGYSRCPSCSNRTKSSDSTTVRRATEYSEGLVRVDERCVQCSYTNSYTRVTARIERSTSSSSSYSSSSSSSSSSFGGGSSSGGGSSGSW